MFRRQLGMMKSTLADTKDAANAARKNADATERLVERASDTAKKELRAYVGVREQRIQELGNNQYQAFILIENSGKTPAYELKFTWNWALGGRSGPSGGFTLPKPIGSMPFAPSGQRPIRQGLWTLTQDDIPRIATDGSHDIYVWGRIEYKDIYGDDRHVSFRFVTREITREQTMDRNGRLLGTRITGWALQPTPEGNDAS
jgi:hypothetical protein